MIYALLQEIKAFLVEEFKSAAGYERESELVKEPTVLIGEVPVDNVESFPFVAISALSGHDTHETQSVEVNIVCGAFTSETFEEGVQNIQNLIDRCRIALLRKQPSSAFTLQRPLDWEIGVSEDEYQPHPFYLGMIRTTWTTIPIELECPYDE